MNSPDITGSDREHNKATARILSVLSEFLADVDGFGVTELTQRLGMTKNMVHRALTTLGELDRAREHFRQGMEISERLVDLDPYNGAWNWDLFRAYQRMASSTPPGTEWHRKALGAIEKMDEEGLLAADNRQWIGITRERLEASLTKAAK